MTLDPTQASSAGSGTGVPLNTAARAGEDAAIRVPTANTTSSTACSKRDEPTKLRTDDIPLANP